MRDRMLLCLLALAMLANTGCKVHVDKSEDNQNIKVATPFGSIAVNRNQTTAAEVGLPAYPGARIESRDNKDKSASVDVGFGAWKLRVRVASYTSVDDRDQVVAFYRKALSAYGGVIECAGKRPVGTPARTGEGLTCSDNDADKHPGLQAMSDGDVQLKAGSPHHQHLVSITSNGSAPTHFSLIALDLPHGDNGQRGTN